MQETTPDFAWEAQLHKEAYSAVVNSALRTPGAKQDFALLVGISPQYLSYLLNPYDPHTPGPEVAEKMAAALPLDPEQRVSVYEHLQRSRQRRVDQARSQRPDSTTPPLSVQVAILAQQHHLATISTATDQSQPRFLAIRDTGKALLRQINPHRAPLPFIQLCFLLHDIQCLLNRPDEALYYAKFAYWLVQSLDGSLYRAQREYVDRLELHAIRAQTVAYHNLKLPKNAYDCCGEAETANAVRQRPEEYKPHLLRDTLNALSRTTRFSVHEAEALAQEATDLCQHLARPSDPMWNFMMQRSLGRAYHTHGNPKKARRVFEALLDQMHTIPQLGPVPQTLFLNTYAALLKEQGHIAEWQAILQRAVSLADATQLTRAFVEMREHYGPTMGPLLTEMGIIPPDVNPAG
ncbi:MAG TPA: helix-turn-helix transcriptional regulator [Ktedonobacterales bacterium]|nr:helix-turn-helix transcriptional regulator [Ktedonobacterales bacterium]